MAEKLHFSLVAPEREVFSGEVDRVDAPGVEGDFGVLANHAPFMTALREGVVEGGRFIRAKHRPARLPKRQSRVGLQPEHRPGW